MANKASIKTTFRIEGDKELIEKIQAIAGSVIGKHLEEAALKGAEIIRDEAVRRAPRGATGKLKDNIVAEVAANKQNIVEVHIGPNKEAWYGHLVEFGHALVKGSKKATRKVIGHVPPHPFLRPAFDEKKREAEKAVEEELRRRILEVAE